MKKKIAVIDTTRQKPCIASSGKLHLADTLKPFFRSLLFLLVSGIFIFSCDDTVKPSSEASITSLTLTVGDTDYPVTFAGKKGTITVPYSTKWSDGAVVKVVTLSAKATGVKVGAILPISASGTATLTVTAEDGTTTGVYTITVKKALPRIEASITDLTLTVGRTNYDITFENTQSTVMLPDNTEIPTTVIVTSVQLSAGATGVVQGSQLSVTDNTVRITVTAEDGETTQTYTVTLLVDTNDEASITSLKLKVGDTDYDVTFADTQGSVKLPYGTAVPATVEVTNIVLSAGATSDTDNGNELDVTDNAVTITVTGGETTQTYTVTLSVGANDDAGIASLKLKVGDKDYDVTFADTQGSVKLPYGTVVPARVEVTNITLSTGATSDTDNGNELDVTNNAVTIMVTAEDGETTREYTVTLVVSQTMEPLFTSFTFTTEGNEAMALAAEDRQEIVGIIDNDADTITFAQQSAYVYLNNLKATFTTSDGATVQVGDIAQESGVTEQDFTLPVSYVVRSEDGTETTTYTVTLAKSTLATIEDDQFRAKLQELVPDAFTGDQLDITHDELIDNDELRVNFQNPGITSLKGIEFFTALTYLDCHANALTSLDVRKNTSLVFLDCSTNGLMALDVRANTALESLYCSDNALTSLDVSAHTSLTILDCNTNSLTSLDITGMRSIRSLGIGTGAETNNPLATLRVNTAVQDHMEMVTMKKNRKADLTITTVNNDGDVVCADYSPVVGRCGPLSTDAGITSLQLSVSGSDYDATFTDTQGSVTLPYGTVIPATVGVTSVALSDGATGVEQGNDLTVTNNAVTITVMAEDGMTEQAYTVTLSVGANDEAGITTLQLSVAGSDYDVTFTDTQGSVIVSYGTVIPATVSVASVALSDGATGVVMGNDLTVTNNAVTFTVTAEDGTTEKTYTVTLSVGANDEASITTLKLSVSGSDYDITFTDTQGSVIVPYGTAIPATVGITSVALSDGATGIVQGAQLNVVEDKVILTVTAEDGETEQAYTVTLSVGANDEAGITTLQLSVAGSAYDIIFENTQGSVIVPYGTAIPATVGVTSVALSDGATGIVQGAQLNVVEDKVTLTVTAEDGETEQAYTVTLSVGANDEAGITTLQLSVAGSDYDVIFVDTQGSVIVPYGTAIPATVGVASVALSDGATGIVQGAQLNVVEDKVTLTVTAADGITTQTYTVTLSVGANDEAGITTLQLSVAGSAYDIIFENTQGSVIVPYGTAIPATVGVTSVALSDGATGIVQGAQLNVVEDKVTLTVTAEDGETEQAYTVTLSVGANDEAGITTLQLSVAGSDYDVIFVDTQGSVIVPYGTAIPATVGVTSVALSDGATGIVQGDDLTVTNNAVTLTVTAEDGETEQAYTVTLSVGANDEAGITTLQLSVSGSAYDIIFENTQGSVIVPYGTAIPATVGVTSVALSDGATGVEQGDDLTVTNNAVTLTVTAEDGETEQAYTVTLSVGANDEAGITTLQLSVSGSDYDITFTDTQGSMTLPYGTAIPATVGVTSVALSDGATGIVQGAQLNVVEDKVTLTVTAEDGETEQTYTVTLSVGANDEAGITTLQLSVAGSAYDIIFENTQGSVIVPYGTAIPATVGVTSVALSDGATGVEQGDDLPVTNNAVTITVTAEDGETEQAYTVTLSVGANDEAGITTLQLSVSGSAYDIIFENTQGSVIVPYGTAIPATVGVTSVALSDGATGIVQGAQLNVVEDKVTLTVTAEDGETEQAYTVTLSVGANDEAGITTLQLSVAGSDYDITFENTQGSVIVPYGTAIPATVGVTSVALSDGATGVEQGDDLTVTNNAVTITVTAEDGETEQAYTVTLSVGANDEAGITTLQLSVAGSDYDIIFENTQGSVIVPYGTAIPATVGVTSVALSDGATGVEQGDDLTVTNNAVTITVTAEDGETEQTYTVTLSVGANDEAGITTLQLSVAGSDYDIMFENTQDSVTLPYGTAIPATVGVTSVALSDGATGVEQGNDLPVTNNAVTITVTAEDGETTQTYTVRLFISVGITTFTFEVADNESMALDVADRQQIVGMINHQASTITFAQQSAYVYRDKLKATFALSEAGAGVQVEGVTHTSGVTEQDFRLPVSYVVRAQDGRETTYTVTLLKSTLATIPDASFRAKLKALFPTAFTGDQLNIMHSDVMNHETIDVSNGNAQNPDIISLKGVEFFTSLKTLNCGSNALPSLDIRRNTSLTSLSCGSNALTSLDVRRNTSLGILNCDSNALSSLDVRENTALTSLSYAANTITLLDLSELTALRTLSCSNNGISSLDIRANTALQNLYCDSNVLTSLDVSANTALRTLNCRNNSLISLDVSGLTALMTVDCRSNGLTSLTVIGNTSLQNLYCSANDLTSLNLSDATGLQSLYCNNNDLTFLDMTGMRSVTGLNIGTGGIGNNPLATLRVNTALQDRTDMVTLKKNRKAELTIITVDNTGTVVCADYNPVVSHCGLLSNDASITDLMLTVAGTDYDVTFTGTQDTLRIGAFGTPIPSTVTVKSVTLSNGTTGVVMDDEFPVTNNVATLTVTAEDGITEKMYTVRLTVSVVITSFTFEVTDNESMALEAVDRQRIVGSINQETKTITFAQQSAYVYRDKLKATFALSEAGAAVQVGGADQTSGTTEQDFGTSVSYVVRAQDGTQTTYTVTLAKSTLATIPDASFRAKLKALFPTAFTGDQLNIMHNDVINNSGTLNVNNQNPKLVSLKGIEFFKSLTVLYCGFNALTALDVSKNTALTILYCYRNDLTALDVSKNTALTEFRFQYNDVTSVDVRANTALTFLHCIGNGLTALDVTENTALTTLYCESNALTSLDLSKNTALAMLYCNGNDLSSLDVSENIALTYLNCRRNSLASLDVSANTALEELYCEDNDLASLDVSGNTVLTVFNCGGNNLTSLDMTGMRNIDLLRLGTGTGTDLEPDNHLLATLRVNTAVQDDANIVTIKTARGVDLTITTVNNNGDVVCNDYIPAENGGNCNAN